VGDARNSRAGSGSALKGRLRRWLRPPRKLRPTRAGWIFCALSFGVGFAALNTGNNLLYLVLSLMLAFLVLSGVMSESALRGIRVRRELPRDMFAGETSAIALEISNLQPRIPAFAVLVEDRVREIGRGERAAGRAFALRVDAGSTETRSYNFAPSRRGRVQFVCFRVYTRFPFGLFSKSLRIDSESESVVYPEIEAVSIPREFGTARGGGERMAAPGGFGVDAVGLREFQHGDTVRRIHWRSSLRHRALLVTETENDHEAEVEVRLRTRDVPHGDHFEERVIWAASEVVALLDADTRVSLKTDGQCFTAGSGRHHRARLLAFLALVQPDERPATVSA
jgi:uncharacterized protein (DUF58 family)